MKTSKVIKLSGIFTKACPDLGAEVGDRLDIMQPSHDFSETDEQVLRVAGLTLDMIAEIKREHINNPS